MDPSYFVIQDMRKTRKTIITEMLNLATRAKNISNIKTYIEGDIGRIADEIDKTTKEGIDMAHSINNIIEGIKEHLRRVTEIGELTWNNWSDAICH